MLDFGLVMCNGCYDYYYDTGTETGLVYTGTCYRTLLCVHETGSRNMLCVHMTGLRVMFRVHVMG